MLGADNIEVAKQDDVAVFSFNASCHELCEGVDFFDPPLHFFTGIRTIIKMDGAKTEREPAGTEGDGVGSSCELAFSCNQRPFGKHNFPGDVVKADLSFIKQDGPAFPIAAGAFRDVCGDEIPPRSQQIHHAAQWPEVFANFLQGDDVESGNDLGDVVKGLLQPWTVAISIAVEVSQIPRGKQQVILQIAGRNFTR